MTPRVLFASGIGKKSNVNNLGAESIVNNHNVGRNLQDHPVVGVIIEMNPALNSAMPSTFDIANQFVQYAEAVERYREHRSTESFGVFASTGLSGTQMCVCACPLPFSAFERHFLAGGFVASPYATDGEADASAQISP